MQILHVTQTEGLRSMDFSPDMRISLNPGEEIKLEAGLHDIGTLKQSGHDLVITFPDEAKLHLEQFFKPHANENLLTLSGGRLLSSSLLHDFMQEKGGEAAHIRDVVNYTYESKEHILRHTGAVTGGKIVNVITEHPLAYRISLDNKFSEKALLALKGELPGWLHLSRLQGNQYVLTGIPPEDSSGRLQIQLSVDDATMPQVVTAALLLNVFQEEPELIFQEIAESEFAADSDSFVQTYPQFTENSAGQVFSNQLSTFATTAVVMTTGFTLFRPAEMTLSTFTGLTEEKELKHTPAEVTPISAVIDIGKTILTPITSGTVEAEHHFVPPKPIEAIVQVVAPGAPTDVIQTSTPGTTGVGTTTTSTFTPSPPPPSSQPPPSEPPPTTTTTSSGGGSTTASSSLFTTGDDHVDFNTLGNLSSYSPNTVYTTFSGNDTVLLPTAANAALFGFNPPNGTFTLGDGTDSVSNFDLNISIHGGLGDDLFVLHDLFTNTIGGVTQLVPASIDGGGGLDTLQIDVSNADMNFPQGTFLGETFATNTIPFVNFATVDLTGGGTATNNVIGFSPDQAATILGNEGNTLTIVGDATDHVFLYNYPTAGVWTLLPPQPGFTVYAGLTTGNENFQVHISAAVPITVF